MRSSNPDSRLTVRWFGSLVAALELVEAESP